MRGRWVQSGVTSEIPKKKTRLSKSEESANKQPYKHKNTHRHILSIFHRKHKTQTKQWNRKKKQNKQNQT